MSRDTRRFMATTWLLATAALTVAVYGCGRDDTSGSKSLGRAGADTLGQATGAQARTAAATPTPGFTSAQGTPPAQPAPAIAPAAVAARMAPPPPTTLATRTSAEQQAALRALPAGPGHDLVLANCLTCHAATIITQQHKDTAGWNKTVTQMIAWGAPVAKDQQAALVAYLFEHFPARAASEPSRQVR